MNEQPPTQSDDISIDNQHPQSPSSIDPPSTLIDESLPDEVNEPHDEHDSVEAHHDGDSVADHLDDDNGSAAPVESVTDDAASEPAPEGDPANPPQAEVLLSEEVPEHADNGDLQELDGDASGEPPYVKKRVEEIETLVTSESIPITKTPSTSELLTDGDTDQTEDQTDTGVEIQAPTETEAEAEIEPESDPSAEEEYQAETEPQVEAVAERGFDASVQTEAEAEAEADDPEVDVPVEVEAEDGAEVEQEVDEPVEAEVEAEAELEAEAEEIPEAEEVNEPEQDAPIEAKTDAAEDGTNLEAEPIAETPDEAENDPDAEITADTEVEAEAEAETVSNRGLEAPVEMEPEPEVEAEVEAVGVPEAVAEGDQVGEAEADAEIETKIGTEGTDDVTESVGNEGNIQGEDGEAEEVPMEDNEQLLERTLREEETVSVKPSEMAAEAENVTPPEDMDIIASGAETKPVEAPRAEMSGTDFSKEEEPLASKLSTGVVAAMDSMSTKAALPLDASDNSKLDGQIISESSSSSGTPEKVSPIKPPAEVRSASAGPRHTGALDVSSADLHLLLEILGVFARVWHGAVAMMAFLMDTLNILPSYKAQLVVECAPPPDGTQLTRSELGKWLEVSVRKKGVAETERHSFDGMLHLARRASCSAARGAHVRRTGLAVREAFTAVLVSDKDRTQRAEVTRNVRGTLSILAADSEGADSELRALARDLARGADDAVQWFVGAAAERVARVDDSWLGDGKRALGMVGAFRRAAGLELDVGGSLVHRRSYCGKEHDEAMLVLCVHAVTKLCSDSNNNEEKEGGGDGGYIAALQTEWDRDVARDLSTLKDGSSRDCISWALARADSLRHADGSWGAAGLARYAWALQFGRRYVTADDVCVVTGGQNESRGRGSAIDLSGAVGVKAVLAMVVCGVISVYGENDSVYRVVEVLAADEEELMAVGMAMDKRNKVYGKMGRVRVNDLALLGLVERIGHRKFRVCAALARRGVRVEVDPKAKGKPKAGSKDVPQQHRLVMIGESDKAKKSCIAFAAEADHYVF